MAVKHSSVSVLNVAISLTSGVVDRSTNNYGDITRRVVLTNDGLAAVFLGGPDVTISSYGRELAPSESIALDLSSTDELFAISANVTTGETVRLLHLGV